MREEEDEDFFSELELTGPGPKPDVAEEPKDSPGVFVNRRKKKPRVTKEEQADADSQGIYLPNSWKHGAVVSDTTEGAIRRVIYEDGYIKTKVGGIWV